MILNEIMPDIAKLQPNSEIAVNETITSVNNFIKTHCSQFLKIVISSKRFLYRGFKEVESEPHSNMFIGYPRADRRPVDSQTSDDAYANAANYTDMCLKRSGFSALRGNSIFCNSKISEATPWGEVYLIFPINGYTFGYSSIFSGCAAISYKFKVHTINYNIQWLCRDILKTDIGQKNNKIYMLAEELKNDIVKQTIFRYIWPLELRKKLQLLLKMVKIEIEKSGRSYPFMDLYDTYMSYTTWDSESAVAIKEFISSNHLTNTRLDWAMKKGVDVWIHGAYIAINKDFRNEMQERYPQFLKFK
jgi:hypothetical protein